MAADPVTYLVDDAGDAVDALPGDGSCATAAGTCTLRAAVQEANAGGVPATIVLDPPGPVVLSIAGAGEDDATSGDLDLRVDVTITATTPGQVVDAAGLDRVFHVVTGGATRTVRLQGLHLRGGWVAGPGAAGQGGALRLDGRAEVTLEDVTISDSHARDGGGIFAASAGFASGTPRGALELRRVHIHDTTATEDAGAVAVDSGVATTIEDTTIEDTAVTDAVDGDGGAIEARRSSPHPTPLQLRRSLLRRTSSPDEGGAIMLNGGWQLLVEDTTIADTAAGAGPGGHGGAVASEATSTTAPDQVVLRRARLVGGRAGGGGGGVALLGTAPSELTVEQSELSGGTAPRGAAIELTGAAHRAVVRNSTLSGAGSQLWVAGDADLVATTLVGDGVVVDGTGAVRLAASVVAGDCRAVTSLGGVVSTGSGCVGGADDRLVSDLGLGPLDPPTPTRVHPLQPDSPARDAADCTDPTTGGTLSVDQRDTPRPSDGDGDGVARCDAGAVEAPTSPPRTVALEAAADRVREGERLTVAVVRRSGAGPVHVELAVGGEATPGSDLPALPAAVDIPADSDRVELTIAPTVDGLAEGSETLTIAVGSGDGYTPAAPTAVEITILDADPPELSRWWGRDRVTTAVDVSRHAFPSGASEALLVRADLPVDALAAAPLATARGAPVLLTPTDHLPAAVTEELRRLGAGRVTILGGTRAVGTAVEVQLRGELGVVVGRIAGADRYETAARIAAVLGPRAEVVIASGEGSEWPDALTGGALAVTRGAVVLLATRDRIPETTAAALDALEPHRIWVVGGPAAVTATVVGELTHHAPVVRLAGADRYRTALAVADVVGAERSPRRVWVASGPRSADALVAAPVAGQAGVLLLVHPDGVDLPPPSPAPLVHWLEDHREVTAVVVVVGGTAAVSRSVFDAIGVLTGR